jgi:hypothetical protein
MLIFGRTVHVSAADQRGEGCLKRLGRLIAAESAAWLRARHGGIPELLWAAFYPQQKVSIGISP